MPLDLELTEYEYGPDHSARAAMAALWPIKVLVRWAIQRFSEPTVRGNLLGSAVKVSDRQFPAIKRVTDVCRRMLSVGDVDVFIATSSSLNASTYGVGGRAVVVLTSGLVETLDPDELHFVLGHELGHIKSDHVLYLTIIQFLKQGVASIPMVGASLLDLLNFVLLPWHRNSEVTADRAGLVCCQSLQTATRTLTKLSLGSRELFERIDLDEFLGQYRDLRDGGSWGEYMQIHPFVLTRIRMLQAFQDSPGWHRLMLRARHPHRPWVPCYYCGGGMTLLEFDRPLDSLACPSCSHTLFPEELPCPHCGAPIHPVDPTRGVAGLVCQGCSRPYFMGDERRVGDAWNTGHPVWSAYRLLALPFDASDERVGAAYVAAMRDAAGPDATARRIELHRAYTALSSARRRIRHDAEIDRAIRTSLGPDGADRDRLPGPSCRVCQIRGDGDFCGECGSPRRLETLDEGAVHGAGPDATLDRLRRALVSETSFGADLAFFLEPPFELCWTAGGHTFHVTRHEGPLTTPAPIRKLVAAANRISERLARQSWLRASATFLVMVQDEVDVHLLHGILTREFVDRRGLAGAFSFLLLHGEADGTWRIAGRDEAHGLAITFADLEALAAHLGETMTSPPGGTPS